MGIDAEKKIIIDLEFRMGQARRQMQASQVELKKNVQTWKKRAALIRNTVSGEIKNLNLGAKLNKMARKDNPASKAEIMKQANLGLFAAQEKLYKSQQKGAAEGRKNAGILAEQKKKTAQLQNQMKSAHGTFQGWAMSLMFAGMALQRMFFGVAKSAMATFNEISASVEGSTTDFKILEGTFKELQFVIGAALEPVVELLLPIIDRVIDWVSQNQELTKDFIIWGAILGSILMVLGMATLAIVNGIIPAAKLLGLAFTNTISPAIAGVASALGVTVLGLILGVIAVVTVLAAMWKTNFGGMRDTIKKVFGTIWNTIKKVFGNIKEMASGLFDILTGIFTGDLDKILGGFNKVLAGGLKLAVNLIAGVADLIVAAFEFSFNIVNDLVFNTVKIIVQGLQKVVTWVDNVFGTSLADKLGDFNDYLERTKIESRIDFNTPGQSAADFLNEGIDKLFNVNVDVTLDGDSVTEKVSTRINDSADAGGSF